MDRYGALLAAAMMTAAVAGCGGGGGNPGVCAGSLEVCSEGRDEGETVITTNGIGTAGGVTPTPSTPGTSTETGPGGNTSSTTPVTLAP